MYAEVNLNEKLIPYNERFDQRMQTVSPGSRSFLNNNAKTPSDVWYIVGGTAITIDDNF